MIIASRRWVEELLAQPEVPAPVHLKVIGAAIRRRGDQ
ncbi:hypothetical protein XINFAN_02930 [Pseudogemmobacter humi]|uniref:Uncharacterized protein n=1 Tax=Pseudogemmobacter humi TaxID=2483812 RepID=A0A3P5XU16_9RHOB|nr:hypothetical protein XINFAN_02930 [Pseudogemmobacter humi]